MRGIKLEDIKLKMGDIITFEDGNKSIAQKDIDYPGSFLRIIKVERPIKYETVYEVPKEILTKKERQYLENFLRPFKDRVESINKNAYGESREYIIIWLSFGEDIELPLFAKNTMYKGMELNKEYTLEDLGLFKEE